MSRSPGHPHVPPLRLLCAGGVAFAETLPDVTLKLVDASHSLSGQCDFIWSSMKEFLDLRELRACDEG